MCLLFYLSLPPILVHETVVFLKKRVCSLQIINFTTNSLSWSSQCSCYFEHHNHMSSVCILFFSVPFSAWMFSENIPSFSPQNRSTTYLLVGGTTSTALALALQSTEQIDDHRHLSFLLAVPPVQVFPHSLPTVHNPQGPTVHDLACAGECG